MSSLGALATSAFFAAIALVSIGFLIALILMGCALIRDSLIAASEDIKRLSGFLEIRNLTILPDNRSIEVVLLNRGHEPIKIEEFDKMDVIAVYRSHSGALKAIWLPYDPEMNSSYGWRPLNITCDGLGELLNPASPDMSSGLWDPGESLAIRAWLSDEVDGSVKLIVVAPSGVSSA
ncbi:MAG: hypothetical protein NZ918_03120 [Aigarchaeota archaeon]|nr:hypothetical protein [Aigarchaeota archaeon]MDW8021922.1 hypothetical protein [Nitrososphaerota archaeon]